MLAFCQKSAPPQIMACPVLNRVRMQCSRKKPSNMDAQEMMEGRYGRCK